MDDTGVPEGEMAVGVPKLRAEVQVEVKDFHFPPVLNGMDYLESVVTHLRGEPSTRDLKYGVLHLQAATEVLLKTPLVEHDWQLVVDLPKGCTEEQYVSGDFKSVGIKDAVKLLRSELGIDVPEEARNAINELVLWRNALQHFGLTVTAEAVAARAAAVLDFLLDFIKEHLTGALAEDDAQHVATQMESVSRGLGEITALVQTRLRTLKPRLEGLEEVTVQCPQCGNWTMVVDEAVDCLYCTGSSWTPEAACLAYAVSIQGNSWRDYRKDPSGPRETCPDCDGQTLVNGVRLAHAPEQEHSFCFGCSARYQGLEHCMRCTRLFQPGEEESVCDDCWHEAIQSD